MRDFLLIGAILVIGLAIASCGGRVFPDRAPKEYVLHELSKLAPVELQTDLSELTDTDKQTLKKLIEAAKIIDELFLVQVNPDNPEIRQKLIDARLDAHYDLFSVMFGPWNRLEEHEPFITGEEKPAGAGFYPEDMTKDEFLNHLKEHPEDEDAFTSEFTLIRRENGSLTAIPYHEAYADKVQKVSQLLNEAAELTDDPTLAKFLRLRAEAFLTDDYFESDMAWMDLSGNLEIVISPYEVYEDNLFNYKAAYEAFLCSVDHAESEKLAKVAQYLNEMERHLPIPDQYKNFNRGSSSPIKVVQELFAAGDTKAGIQTTAFNLPNDERVREAKGSKKVMLKNIARAKYDKCWVPIVNTILAEEPLKHVSFDAYFNHVLMHEMSHGLGPGNITLEDGTETSVGKELKELYSTIEECKADILGVWNMKYMIDLGVFPDEMETSMYASYLGGMFRSIRFGIDEAHGGGVAIQFNYFMETGAFYVNDNGKLDYRQDKLLPSIEELSKKLLILQAQGDYDAAKALIDKYRVMSPVMADYIEQLKDVPVDIRPSYPILDQLAEM